MAPRPPHHASLLGELRRREWRRLLLAFALLAVWARLLVPVAAEAASAPADAPLVGAICTLADAGAAEADADAPSTLAHDDRLCPFCRVGEAPLDLAPGPSGLAVPTSGIVLRAPSLRPAPPLRAYVSHPRPRGPPGIVTTL